jgi:hypothetical protein
VGKERRWEVEKVRVEGGEERRWEVEKLRR